MNQCFKPMACLAGLLAALALLGCTAAPPAAPPQEVRNLGSPGATVALDMEFRIDYQAGNTGSELTVLLPRDDLGRQRIVKETFSSPPTVHREGENRYASFDLDSLGQPKTISARFEIELFPADLATVSAQESSAGTQRLKDPGRFLAAERYLETDAPALRTLAATLRAPDQVGTVRNIHDYVVTHVTYSGPNGEDRGALAAFETGSGDCTEFADLFVTLCRINGIPARSVEGYTALGAFQQHDWAEAYLDRLGWVPFDPTWTATDDETTFDHLRTMYVALSSERTDPTLMGYHYYTYRYYGNPISVLQTATVEPL